MRDSRLLRTQTRAVVVIRVRRLRIYVCHVIRFCRSSFAGVFTTCCLQKYGMQVFKIQEEHFR